MLGELGPIILIVIFWLDPPYSSYSNLKVLNRSQSGPNEGQVVSEIDHVVSELDYVVSEKDHVVSDNLKSDT